MNLTNEISDEEFVPFLNELGVETYKKSFEWMLNDPDFAGVLRWIYKNLDHNNALTAREEYRYTELEKKGCLLSPAEISSSISALNDQYPGLCIPGEQEGREDMELDVKMLRESINMLEKQEMMLQDLIRENNRINEVLTQDLVRLNAAHHCVDEGSAADECSTLARELDSITDDIITVIGDKLELYTNCKNDKEMANRFYTFAPLDSYRQSQALFRSHCNLFVSKNLVSKQSFITDDELRSTLGEAKNMEERLADAAFSYIDSRAEHSGEQAKLELMKSYHNVHPSQITSILMETQSALDLLEQEENILLQEMQNGVEQLVKRRTCLAVNTATAAAVAVRKQMLSSLSLLEGWWQSALSLDRLVYACLRRELRAAGEFITFATHLARYKTTDSRAVQHRTAAMVDICSEQDSSDTTLQVSNLLEVLTKTLDAPSTDAAVVVRVYNDMRASVREMEIAADEGRRRKKDRLGDMRNSSKPLLSYIWDGCTKHPNSGDRTVSALSRSLDRHMHVADGRVQSASALFTNLKNGDKQNLRKLWQWFVTDTPRLLAATKNATSF